MTIVGNDTIIENSEKSGSMLLVPNTQNNVSLAILTHALLFHIRVGQHSLLGQESIATLIP